MDEMIVIGGPLPSITQVQAGRGKTLRLRFKHEGWRTVDLEGTVSRTRAFAPLRDPGLFRKVQVIDGGAAIGWQGDLDLGASTLLSLAEEQKPFKTRDFVRWQEKTGLSNAEAADALGLSVATIKNYRSGANIPTAVAIACRAMAADPMTLAAHFRPRKAGRPKAA